MKQGRETGYGKLLYICVESGQIWGWHTRLQARVNELSLEQPWILSRVHMAGHIMKDKIFNFTFRK